MDQRGKKIFVDFKLNILPILLYILLLNTTLYQINISIKAKGHGVTKTKTVEFEKTRIMFVVSSTTSLI